MISVKISPPDEFIAAIKERGPKIIEALTLKMNELMLRLQNKVTQQTIPAMFKSAPNITSTVQYIPAHLEGTWLVGAVKYGGSRTTKITLKSGAPVDYAEVQEKGVDHGWEILPFNKKALAFMMDGKKAIYRRVWHPPLEARPFMRSALEEMTPTIIEELQAAWRQSLIG